MLQFERSTRFLRVLGIPYEEKVAVYSLVRAAMMGVSEKS